MFHLLFISLFENRASVSGKGSILNKINVSFVVNSCLSKYNFSLDTFWTHILNTLCFIYQYINKIIIIIIIIIIIVDVVEVVVVELS